jgi:hypothetical protein
MQLMLLQQQNKQRLIMARQKQGLIKRPRYRNLQIELKQEEASTIANLLLVTGKVNSDVKDKDGRTLLSIAAEKGAELLVSLLLATGKVNANAKDK